MLQGRRDLKDVKAEVVRAGSMTNGSGSQLGDLSLINWRVLVEETLKGDKGEFLLRRE
jgi:hypothetical protein